MSEQKHTPGPWEVDDHAGRLEIVGRPTWKCRRFGVDGEWRVATIDDLSEDQDGAESETQANASLIAAAPELLDALKAMAKEFRQLDLPYGSHAYLLANKAIAKAEGRS